MKKKVLNSNADGSQVELSEDSMRRASVATKRRVSVASALSRGSMLSAFSRVSNLLPSKAKASEKAPPVKTAWDMQELQALANEVGRTREIEHPIAVLSPTSLEEFLTSFNGTPGAQATVIYQIYKEAKQDYVVVNLTKTHAGIQAIYMDAVGGNGMTEVVVHIKAAMPEKSTLQNFYPHFPSYIYSDGLAQTMLPLRLQSHRDSTVYDLQIAALEIAFVLASNYKLRESIVKQAVKGNEDKCANYYSLPEEYFKALRFKAEYFNSIKGILSPLVADDTSLSSVLEGASAYCEGFSELYAEYNDYLSQANPHTRFVFQG